MRKTNRTSRPNAVATVSPDPAGEANELPAGIRTRQSLRTHGPIGVHYEVPPPLADTPDGDTSTARAAREETEEV